MGIDLIVKLGSAEKEILGRFAKAIFQSPQATISFEALDRFLYVPPQMSHLPNYCHQLTLNLKGV